MHAYTVIFNVLFSTVTAVPVASPQYDFSGGFVGGGLGVNSLGVDPVAVASLQGLGGGIGGLGGPALGLGGFGGGGGLGGPGGSGLNIGNIAQAQAGAAQTIGVTGLANSLGGVGGGGLGGGFGGGLCTYLCLFVVDSDLPPFQLQALKANGRQSRSSFITMISKSLAVLVLAFAAVDALPAAGQLEKRQFGFLPAATGQVAPVAPGRATRLSENVFQMNPVDARSPYSSILMIFQMKQQTPGDAILDEARRYASMIQQQQQRGMANAGQLGGQVTQSQQQQQQQPAVVPGMAPQAGLIYQGASNTNTAMQPSPNSTPANAVAQGPTVAAAGQTGSAGAGNPTALPVAPAALPTGSGVQPTNATVVSKRQEPIVQMREGLELSKRGEGRQNTATGTSVRSEQHAESASGPKKEQQHREKVTIKAISNEGSKAAGSARVHIALRNAALKDSMEGLTSQ
ncbi:hypothetical protein BCR37DRAFT_385421 [Protomyces lactucae-debilis]|uniref:Uncharacterized protein n=1 Tax=Protomyces lactucae-debilis TaxID=2754530 RepID=A0A1Y2FSS0_PROLT|nr:uncharacterized protein BCR37DRAFT_385421 [Protomyces lactucae-debilis]ORY86979.1 hypothetical protein BCR37DRAFT_385421 [Protomyces lactucae-debilis]